MFLLNSRYPLACAPNKSLRLCWASFFLKELGKLPPYLQDTSLKRLGILYLTTCVGFGYGLYGGAISWDPFEARPIQ